MKGFNLNAKVQFYLLWFFVSVVVCVKLFHIGYRSFSLDELYGVCAALEPNFSDFLGKWVLYDSNPPLYYFLLRAWLQFFPATEFWVRLPSVLLILLATYFFVNGVKKRLGNDTWVWLLLLCGSSYGLLFFAQEARAYALLLFFTVLQLLVFIDLLRCDAPRLRVGWLFRFGLLCVLSSYTHYTGIIFSAILFTFLFYFHYGRPKIIGQLALACLFIIISGLPWLPYFLVILKIDKSFVITQSHGIINEILSMLFFGHHRIGKSVSVILLGALPVLFLLNLKTIHTLPRATKTLLALGLLSACVIIASPYLPYFYYYRHYMVLLPVVLLSSAVVLALKKTPLWVKITALFLALMVSAEQGLTHYKSQREAWRQSVQYLVEDNAGKDAVAIVIGEPWEKTHLDYLAQDPGYLNLAIRKKAFYQFYFNRFDPQKNFKLVVLRPVKSVIEKFVADQLDKRKNVYLLSNGGEFSDEIARLHPNPNVTIHKTGFFVHDVYHFGIR